VYCVVKVVEPVSAHRDIFVPGNAKNIAIPIDWDVYIFCGSLPLPCWQQGGRQAWGKKTKTW
jgi:hypothetical protein